MDDKLCVTIDFEKRETDSSIQIVVLEYAFEWKTMTDDSFALLYLHIRCREHMA